MKGCSKLSKAKLFPCWLVGWFLTKQYCVAPLFSSACPRSLAAWSSHGRTRDMMQDVTVGKVNKDSSCPGGSFGAAASSHRQKEPAHSVLGCCTGAEEWKSDGTLWELQAGNNQKGNGNSQSKACLTQVMLFSRKKTYFIWRASKSRGHKSQSAAYPSTHCPEEGAEL